MDYSNNHVRDIVAVDFFTVPTVTFRVLYVFIVLAHDRRRVLHFNVTERPSAEWAARQVRGLGPIRAIPQVGGPHYRFTRRAA